VHTKRLLVALFSLIWVAGATVTTSLYGLDEPSFLLRGSMAEEHGDFEEAIRVYRKALDKYPEQIVWYSKIGYIYQYELQNYSEAINTYLEGLRYAPRAYDLNLAVMYCYFEKGDVDNGIKHYRILAKLDGEGGFSFTRTLVKQIFENMSEEEKLSFCKEFLAINPSDIILREKLASIYSKRKEYKKAKTEYETLFEYHDPRDKDGISMTYFGLGVCSFYLGEYEEALEFLLKAKELDRYVPEVYFDMVKQKIEEKP